MRYARRCSDGRIIRRCASLEARRSVVDKSHRTLPTSHFPGLPSYLSHNMLAYLCCFPHTISPIWTTQGLRALSSDRMRSNSGTWR